MILGYWVLFNDTASIEKNLHWKKFLKPSSADSVTAQGAHLIKVHRSGFLPKLKNSVTKKTFFAHHTS